jgi:hypothetical protein
LEILSHRNTDGWASGEKEIGHVHLALQGGGIGFVAPLIYQIKITDAVPTAHALEVIVHHGGVQVYRVVDGQHPFRLQLLVRSVGSYYENAQEDEDFNPF